MKKYIILFVFLACTILSAQEKVSKDIAYQDEILAMHLKIGLGINAQLANFSTFDGMIGCGEYGSVTSFGFYAGGAIEKLLFKNTFLSLGLFYSTNNCDGFGIAFDAKQRDQQYGIIRSVNTTIGLETQMSLFEIQPDFRYIISPTAMGNAPFRMILGARFSIPMSATFRQWEEINSPEVAYYRTSDGEYVKSRDLVEGDITTINSMIPGIVFGFDNLIWLDQGHSISQELLLNYNFSDMTTDANWKLFTVRLAVGYRFGLYPKEARQYKKIESKIVPIEKIQTIDQRHIDELPRTLDVPPEINISFRDISEVVKTSGTELLATVPLVNAVFFPKNSAFIPSDYARSYEEIPDFFRSESVQSHELVIPRIAEILSENKDATIKIVGATSGDDETGGTELAKMRAENVRQAFIAAGVAESKITISAQKKPTIKSNDEFEDGKAENRRADVFISNAPMQEYVDFLNFSEVTGTLILKVETKGMKPSQEISITTSVTDKPFTFKLDQLSNNYEIEMPFKARVKDEKGKLDILITAEPVGHEMLSAQVTGELNIPTIISQEINNDLSKFRAILRFDYDISDLTEANEDLLKQLGEILPEGATISILGSADALGSSARNAQLTKERALKTKAFINKQFSGKFKIVTGQSREKVSEGSPEGRFINRCIIIKVKK